MTRFTSVPLDLIIIEPKRQRQKISDVEELAESINRIGLINPIVITRDGVLVAGERRLTAVKSLGWTSIPVQYVDTLDPFELKCIELEENIKRKDLTWQEENAGIAEIHQMHVERDPSWTQADTAQSIGIAQSTVSSHLDIFNAIKENVPGVADADKLSVARNLVARNLERRRTSTLLSITAPPIVVKTAEGEKIITPEKPQSRIQLLNQDFLTFESEVKFNFVHCDFPYGVSAGDTIGFSGAKLTGTYEDSPDIYFALLEKLCNANFIADSAHLMFWFSMDFYEETRRILQNAGWRLHRFPLIWHKTDNSGIISDKDRWPRHIYETAIMASRGDRKIVRAVSDTVGSAISLLHHTSEKPVGVLSHFFRMFVDTSTVMLDPTAGSANALIVAEQMGANFVMGLEKSEEFHKRALENIQASR